MNPMSPYTETQKFNQTWLKIILYIVLAFGVIVSIVTFFTVEKDFIALIPSIVCIGSFLFFQSITLKTRIDDNGITYQFSPFHRKMKTIPKEDIQQISVKKYNPLSEYGGWGLRFGRAGMAYTTSGVYGISITLRNNKNLLIGTCRPNEVYRYLIDHRYEAGSQGL